jgi:hypothetical protein
MPIAEVTVSGGTAPAWLTAVQIAQLFLLVAFAALALYAGWKAFLWLRGWNPRRPRSDRPSDP